MGPGRHLKSSVGAVGFILSEFRLKRSHGDPIHAPGSYSCDICLVERQDICLVESLDICLVESQDICLVDSQDIRLVESQDIWLAESQDICLVETQVMCCVGNLSAGSPKRDTFCAIYERT